MQGGVCGEGEVTAATRVMDPRWTIHQADPAGQCLYGF